MSEKYIMCHKLFNYINKMYLYDVNCVTEIVVLYSPHGNVTKYGYNTSSWISEMCRMDL